MSLLLDLATLTILGRRMRQTDRRTDTAHHFTMPVPTEVGGIINGVRSLSLPTCTPKITPVRPVRVIKLKLMNSYL